MDIDRQTRQTLTLEPHGRLGGKKSNYPSKFQIASYPKRNQEYWVRTLAIFTLPWKVKHNKKYFSKEQKIRKVARVRNARGPLCDTYKVDVRRASLAIFIFNNSGGWVGAEVGSALREICWESASLATFWRKLSNQWQGENDWHI